MSEENSIFRKSSLERISSPEQLNEYIRVTNPNLFVILFSIIVILASLGIWLFKAEIPKYVNTIGVVTSDIYEPETQNLYCYVPISTSKRIKKGMQVQISPDFAPKEEYGFINGEIKGIGTEIVTGSYLTEKFLNPSILSPVLSNAENSNLVEITVSLGDWSNEKGKALEITEGTECIAAIITGKQKATELIFK